jgi:hypothetical protein
VRGTTTKPGLCDYMCGRESKSGTASLARGMRRCRTLFFNVPLSLVRPRGIADLLRYAEECEESEGGAAYGIAAPRTGESE